MDQRRLVERAREGDHDAFAELVRAAVARLDAAARLILRDPELARDAVQEALIRAWRDLRSLRDPDRFDAWVYRLTVNACLDQARRRRRRPLEVEVTPLFTPSTPDPAIAVADRALVDDVLRRLEPRARDRRPALLPRAAADGRRRLARHPDRHRQVAPASRPRRDAGRGGGQCQLGVVGLGREPRMTGDTRIERALPRILEDLGGGPACPTTSTPSWLGPSRSRSGPAGPSSKGGFPWTLSASGGPPRHECLGARLRSSL